MPRRKLNIGLAPIMAGAAAGAVSDQDDDDITTRVLDATAELLIAYGLRRWTIDDVADRAGLGRTSVYRKFEGRDELVHAVLSRELRQTLVAIEAASAPYRRLEDKIVEGGFVALRALRGSVVEHLLHSDPATFLPFLTTGAGPLITLARNILVQQLRVARPGIDEQHAAEMAELAARMGLSFILTPDTILPVDDEDAARESLRRLLRPLLLPVRRSA